MTLLWIQGCSMDYLLDNSVVRKNILFNRVFPFCKKIHSCRRIAGVNSGCEQLKKNVDLVDGQRRIYVYQN